MHLFGEVGVSRPLCGLGSYREGKLHLLPMGNPFLSHDTLVPGSRATTAWKVSYGIGQYPCRFAIHRHQTERNCLVACVPQYGVVRHSLCCGCAAPLPALHAPSSQNCRSLTPSHYLAHTLQSFAGILHDPKALSCA